MFSDPFDSYDWRSYFLDFCERHGNPVNSGDYLLFPDGWRYHRSNYRGPELPPPQEPAAREELMAEYRRVRSRLLRDEMGRLREIAELQSQRSARLYLKSGFGSNQSVPVDLEELTGRMDSLKEELASLQEGSHASC